MRRRVEDVLWKSDFAQRSVGGRGAGRWLDEKYRNEKLQHPIAAAASAVEGPFKFRKTEGAMMVRDIKLYTTFENDVAPALSPGPSRDYTVVQYGFPGSGSTFVWQVLNAIFGHAKKTHICPDYREDVRVVATIRDFRDVMCTYLRRADLPPTKEGIDFILDKLGRDPLGNLHKVNEIWRGRPNILWLRYEHFALDIDHLFGEIEVFFGMAIPEDCKARCREEFCLNANRERSRTVDALCNRHASKGWLDKRWTQYTIDGINGLHITGNGKLNKWQQDIPEDLHPHLHNRLGPLLETFGYL